MLVDTQVLARTPLFHKVPPQALEVAREAFVTRNYPAGKKIFEAGDMGAALYVVQSGQVRIYRTYLDGRERMFAYLGPGEVFGEMSLLDDQPRKPRPKPRWTRCFWCCTRTPTGAWCASGRRFYTQPGHHPGPPAP